MAILALERVSLAFDPIPLFDDVVLQVEPGERLALVGGQLVIDSSPGHGTRIHARVPSLSATAFA